MYDSPAGLICSLVDQLRIAASDYDLKGGVGLRDMLESLALRGPYRRSACSPVSIEDLRRKIAGAIEASEPIRFTVPFGGYKLWRIESYPRPDWAEIFAILYLVEYLRPMAAVYEPGVEITFSYCSLGVAEANGIGTDSILIYTSEFQAILRECEKLLGQANLALRLFDVATLYSGDEGEQELEGLLLEAKRQWMSTVPREDRERMIASARRNLKLPVGFSPANEAELVEKYEESAQAVYAIDSLSRRRWFNKYSSRIQLVYVRGPEPSIHIGSCRSSICQFNVGSGVLEMSRGGYIPRILSADSMVRSRGWEAVEVQRCWPSLCLLNPRFRFVNCIDNSQGRVV